MVTMNDFDVSIISFLNQFSQRSYTFDQIVIFISGSTIFKGGVFAILLWWFWFRYKDEHLPEQNETRTNVMMVILACTLAVFAVRILAVTTPFKLRPLHDPELNFVVPYDMDTEILQTWNSFPSDHAAMFVALAVSFWYISRSLGVLMFIYVSLFICIPRIYLGLHHPTDIIAGAVIGIGAACLTRIRHIRKITNRYSFKWLRLHPASFYAFFFFVTFQMAVIFNDVRSILKFLLHLLNVIMKFIK